MPLIFWVVPVSGIIAILFAFFLARDVLHQPTGTPKMVEVGEIIYQGARAFLRRQYGTIGVLSVVFSLGVGGLVGFLSRNTGIPGINGFGIAWRTALAFITGALSSGVAGFIGMFVAVKANVRCASASQRSLQEAM